MKAYYQKREAAWKFFHEWERQQKWEEYHAMGYAERFKIFEMLYQWAIERNTSLVGNEVTIAELMKHPNFHFRLEMAQRKQKLTKVKW